MQIDDFTDITHINLHIVSDLNEKLEAFGKKKRTSRAVLISMAVEEFLKNDPDTAFELPREWLKYAQEERQGQKEIYEAVKETGKLPTYFDSQDPVLVRRRHVLVYHGLIENIGSRAKPHWVVLNDF